MDQKRLCFLVNLLYFASIAAIAALTLRFVLPWFWPFLLGLGLAYLFRHISQAMRVRGKAAVACIGVAFYLTIIFLFWALFVLLAGRLVGWAQSFPEYMTGSMLPAADRAFSRCLALLQQLAPQTALSVSGLIPPSGDGGIPVGIAARSSHQSGQTDAAVCHRFCLYDCFLLCDCRRL